MRVCSFGSSGVKHCENRCKQAKHRFYTLALTDLFHKSNNYSDSLSCVRSLIPYPSKQLFGHTQFPLCKLYTTNAAFQSQDVEKVSSDDAYNSRSLKSCICGTSPCCCSSSIISSSSTASLASSLHLSPAIVNIIQLFTHLLPSSTPSSITDSISLHPAHAPVSHSSTLPSMYNISSDSVSISSDISYINGDGNSYIGHMLGDARNGTGMMQYRNGNVYTGQWKNNLYHGIGKMYYNNGATNLMNPNNTIYDGEWQLGQRHGNGTYTEKDSGLKYIGQWSNNVREGYGEQYVNTTLLYKGEWKNNVRHGNGTAYFQVQSTNGDNSIETYEGNWNNGSMDGNGIFTYSNGERYEGEWKSNRMDGNGIFTDNIHTYKGVWKQGLRHGEGILYNNTQQAIQQESYDNGSLVHWKKMQSSTENTTLKEEETSNDDTSMTTITEGLQNLHNLFEKANYHNDHYHETIKQIKHLLAPAAAATTA